MIPGPPHHAGVLPYPGMSAAGTRPPDSCPNIRVSYRKAVILMAPYPLSRRRIRVMAVPAVVLFLLSLAGCATGDASDPYAYTWSVTSVRLKDGMVVDCVSNFGIVCDWNSPRPAKDDERPQTAKYYRLRDGRVVPCATAGGKTSNGLTCDFEQ